jgi:hypothetical protein
MSAFDIPAIAFAATLATTVLAADLVSGLVHWWEDAYARRDNPLFGRVAEANLRHHARPREFLAKGYFESSWDLWLLGGAALAGAAWLGVLGWPIVLFVVLVANANQIHKWAHMQTSEQPRLVAWLQRMQCLQTTRHHSLHHQGARNTHYCVITNVLNPVLEELRLWSRLERAIERVFGLKRRDDEAELAAMGLATRRPPQPHFGVRLTQAIVRGASWTALALRARSTASAPART